MSLAEVTSLIEFTDLYDIQCKSQPPIRRGSWPMAIRSREMVFASAGHTSPVTKSRFQWISTCKEAGVSD